MNTAGNNVLTSGVSVVVATQPLDGVGAVRLAQCDEPSAIPVPLHIEAAVLQVEILPSLLYTVAFMEQEDME